MAECFVLFCDFILAVVTKLYQREVETMLKTVTVQHRAEEKQEISCAESEGQRKV